MHINNPFPYNPSYKIHTIIGAILGLLLGFILIALKPFNLKIDSLDKYGEILLMGFGLIKFSNYMLAHTVENYFYTRNKNWTWWNEIVFLVLSTLSGAILGYLYLDLVIEKQPLSFKRLIFFFFQIVLPMTPLLIFPKLVLRYLFSKQVTSIPTKDISVNTEIQEEKIFLKGQNAKDELVLAKEQIIYVKSVDNYVLIYYKDNDIKNKIMRVTLSELAKQAPFLVQPHRSYLINPKHNFKINGNSQKATLISSNFKEHIPIARSSYTKIKNLFN